MKRLTLGLLIVFSIASCHNVKKPEKPKNLISKDKMVNIIIDMSMLSASRGVDKNALEKNNVTIQSLIYDKYGIDSLQLAKSNEYYSYDIKAFEALYEKVTDSLNILNEKFQAERDEEEERKLKKDSLEVGPVDTIVPGKKRVPKGLNNDSLELSK